jgi:hypothetical protein
MDLKNRDKYDLYDDDRKSLEQHCSVYPKTTFEDRRIPKADLPVLFCERIRDQQMHIPITLYKTV